jgi:hypothetical protein
MDSYHLATGGKALPQGRAPPPSPRDGGAVELRYPDASWRGDFPPPGPPVVDLTDRLVPELRVGRLVISAGLGCVANVTADAHLGVCGPWDGDDGDDGDVWQWQPLGPGDLVVLTSDGGDGRRPWSAQQLRALTEIGTWWCHQSGQPPRPARSGQDGGLVAAGPLAGDPARALGRTRLAQLTDIVVPDITTALRREQAASTTQ